MTTFELLVSLEDSLMTPKQQTAYHAAIKAYNHANKTSNTQLLKVAETAIEVLYNVVNHS